MIPYIPPPPPPGERAAAPASEVPDVDGYPKRSICAHCGEVISQAAQGADWVVAGLFGDARECPEAPNPDDGPMPDHAPGVVLHPPKR